MPPAQHSAGTVGKMLGMEEERIESASGDLAGVPADLPGDSGWIKTRVAAEALGVDPRTVRAYIERGDLVARSEGEGIQKTYLVSIDSVYALRDRRVATAGKPRRAAAEGREKSGKSGAMAGLPGNAAEELTGIIRDLTADLVRKSASESELRTRLELTAQAESTLREDLARERDRAEAERERADRLEAELREARRPLPPPRDERETTAEGSEGTDTPADREKTETGVQRRERSWWRRFFGFE